MKPDLLIKTNLFPAHENESAEINPGRFGKRLAEFIKDNLTKTEIIVADIYPTDYSYELRLDGYKFKIYVLIGNIDGENDQFLISIEPKKAFVRKLFKKISTEDSINKVYNAIRASISNNPEIEIIEH